MFLLWFDRIFHEIFSNLLAALLALAVVVALLTFVVGKIIHTTAQVVTGDTGDPTLPTIAANKNEIVRQDGSGKVIERLSWDEIERIHIAILPLGPMKREILFQLESSNSGKEFIIPQADQRLQPILDRLQKLRGFDHDTMADALATFEQQSFLVWDKHRREE